MKQDIPNDPRQRHKLKGHGPLERYQQTIWAGLCRKGDWCPGITHAVIQTSVELMNPMQIERALGFKVVCIRVFKVLLWGFTSAQHRDEFLEYVQYKYGYFKGERAKPRSMKTALRKHGVHWYNSGRDGNPREDTSSDGIYFEY